MEQLEMLKMLLDNWNQPVVLADTEHIIRYMNTRAIKKEYSRWGDLTGKSILECHKVKSSERIKEIYKQLEEGAEEVLYSNNEKHRIYMRAVRDQHGKLAGYFERYDPPVGK